MTTKEKEIQKLKDVIKECEQKIKKLENSYELEVPDLDVLYDGYILYCNGYIEMGRVHSDNYIGRCYQQGNWFATREEAELERDRRELLAKFRQFRDKCNDGWEPDWNDDDMKYRVNFDGNFFTTWDNDVHDFNIFGYFKNSTDCEKAIELFGEGIMRLYVL